MDSSRYHVNLSYRNSLINILGMITPWKDSIHDCGHHGVELLEVDYDVKQSDGSVLFTSSTKCGRRPMEQQRVKVGINNDDTIKIVIEKTSPEKSSLVCNYKKLDI